MGRTRFVVLCMAAVISFCLNAGAQSFSRSVIADVNGDGKPDVLVLDSTLNNVAVYLNTGNGTLGPGAFFGILPPSSGNSTMVVSDRNGDGIPDIVVFQPQQIQTLLGDGTGNFSVPTAAPLGPVTSSSNVIYADLNGDGLPDLAFGNPVQFFSTNPITPPTISLMFADGHGGFLPPTGLTVAYNTFDFGIGPTSILVADVNNDGNPDLIIGDGIRSPVAFAGFPYLALNDGTGNFKIVPLGGNTTIAAAGDFNDDGDLDFLLDAGNISGTTLFGDGQGGFLFSRSHSLPASSLPFLADFDVSGTLDVVLGPTFLPGNGHGDFGDPISFAASLPGTVIALTDMDGDGRPDLVLNTNPPTVVLNTTVALPVTASTSLIGAISARTTNIGQPVTLAAQLFSNGGVPVGTVTFDDGGTPVSAPVNVYGWASFDTSFTGSGTQSGTVSFVGSTDPATATSFGNSSGTLSAFVLNSPPLLPAPAVTFTMSPNPARERNPVTLTPAVSSPSGTPTGSVIFRADGDVIGSAPVGSFTTVVFPNPGLHNITATYGGDGTFPAASSATVVEDIRALNAVRSSTTTQLSVTPPTASSAAFFAASLAGVNHPSGNFIYRVNGGILAALPAGQAAAFSPPSQGTYTVSAEYAGDAALLSSSASSTFVFGNPAGDFTLSSLPDAVTVKAGQSASYTLSVLPSGGFTQPTTFSCSGLPAGATCAFSPASVSPSVAPVNSVLTVNTTPSAASIPVAPHGSFPAIPLFVATILFASALWIIAFSPRSLRVKVLATTLGLTILLIIVSCGGSGSTPQVTPTPTPTPAASPTPNASPSPSPSPTPSPGSSPSPSPTATPSPSPTPTPGGTPPGSYNFTVTATSAAVTHTFSLSITVQ